MSQSLIVKTDLQFSGTDAVSEKLRRLVADVQLIEIAVNTLIKQLAALASSTTEPVTLAGLTLAGLAAGQVYTALSATSAAFEFLTLAGLEGVALSQPTAGEVLTYEYGQWVNAPLPAVAQPPVGENIGTGAGVYAGILNGNLAFMSIQGDGSTIEVTASADTLTLSALSSGLSAAQACALTSLRI